MNVEVTKLPESRVALKIELSPREVEQALDRTYKQLVQRVTIPGFRKGKAPRPVVERMVGHELFLHEATDEAVRWGYRKAIDQEHLTPIDEAEIQPGEEHEHVEPDQPFAFEARVAVKPEVQLPDYHAIHIERPPVEVPDADVDQLLRELQERNATLEPVVRPAQVGDVVTMNLQARVGGKDVLSDESADFEIRDEETQGPNPLLPGLSPELVGANRGDIREIALTLPELYPEQELAGQTMFVRTLIKEIKRKVLPPLDDEFAQSVSEFQTLDDLKGTLRGNVQLERQMEADEKLVNDAIEAVNSRTFVDLPPVLIEEELDRMMDDMRRAFERQGYNFETYLVTSRKTEAEVRREMRESAQYNVKTSLMVGALADAEGIDVTARDVDASIEGLVRSMSASSAERRRLRTSTAVRSNLRSRLRRQRAIQRLVEIVTGGEEVAPEATEIVADQTAASAEDTEETVAVEMSG